MNEDKYVDELKRQAARFESAGVATEAEVEEIRRWEGQAAAVDAQHPAPKKYTPVSETATGQRTNAFAVLSLVFGIFGGLLAIVFGHIALAQIRRTGEAGYGLALTGLILGYVVLSLAVLFVVVGIAVRFA